MINDVKKSAEQKMGKSVEALKADLGKVRTGRAHTGLLDHIHVDYYGSMMPLAQVANVTLADARTIAVQPWEKKMIPVVEKAIRDSDLGLNPATSGEQIRIPMPALTEERRRELTKVAHKYAEDAKVAIRHIRRDGMIDPTKLVRSAFLALALLFLAPLTGVGGSLLGVEAAQAKNAPLVASVLFEGNIRFTDANLVAMPLTLPRNGHSEL